MESDLTRIRLIRTICKIVYLEVDDAESACTVMHAAKGERGAWDRRRLKQKRRGNRKTTKARGPCYLLRVSRYAFKSARKGYDVGFRPLLKLP